MVERDDSPSIVTELATEMISSTRWVCSCAEAARSRNRELISSVLVSTRSLVRAPRSPGHPGTGAAYRRSPASGPATRHSLEQRKWCPAPTVSPGIDRSRLIRWLSRRDRRRYAADDFQQSERHRSYSPARHRKPLHFGRSPGAAAARSISAGIWFSGISTATSPPSLAILGIP